MQKHIAEYWTHSYVFNKYELSFIFTYTIILHVYSGIYSEMLQGRREGVKKIIVIDRGVLISIDNIWREQPYTMITSHAIVSCTKYLMQLCCPHDFINARFQFIARPWLWLYLIYEWLPEYFLLRHEL